MTSDDDFADEEDFTDALLGTTTEASTDKEGATAQADADIDLYSGVGGSADDSAANQDGEAAQEMQQQHSVPQELTTQTNGSQAAATQARPTVAPSGPVTTAGMALYIGNLQWWTTDADLETLCSKYGQILTLKTFEDKTTGKSKGYVLVHFAAGAAAAACQAELNGRDIHGKACVVTAAQSQGSRAASSTLAPVASSSGRTTPPVRPASNAGRAIVQRQPAVNGRGHGRSSVAKPEAPPEHQPYQGPMGPYPAMGMGLGMHMGMGPPMGMGPMHMPGMGPMGMGPMGMPMPLIPGMFQPPPPPRDSGRRPRSDYDGYDNSYKRSRY